MRQSAMAVRPAQLHSRWLFFEQRVKEHAQKHRMWIDGSIQAQTPPMPSSSMGAHSPPPPLSEATATKHHMLNDDTNRSIDLSLIIQPKKRWADMDDEPVPHFTTHELSNEETVERLANGECLCTTNKTLADIIIVEADSGSGVEGTYYNHAPMSSSMWLKRGNQDFRLCRATASDGWEIRKRHSQDCEVVEYCSLPGATDRTDQEGCILPPLGRWSCQTDRHIDIRVSSTDRKPIPLRFNRQPTKFHVGHCGPEGTDSRGCLISTYYQSTSKFVKYRSEGKLKKKYAREFLTDQWFHLGTTTGVGSLKESHIG